MQIGIVGTGFVGSAAAFALVQRGIGRRVVLVDQDAAKARAEAEDLTHAVPFSHPLEVVAGGYPLLRGSKVVVLAAGVNQRPGETRLQLLGRNALVFAQVVPQVLLHAPDALLLVATNPVDVMTHFAALYAERQGAPAARVFGSGTTLDTARFRAELGRRLGIDARHVHGYVLGEHGDSEVLAWSSVGVGGVPLQAYAAHRGVQFDEAARAEVDDAVRKAAYRIIQGKGATYFGIGSALAFIVEVLVHERRAMLTVCARAPDVLGVADTTVSLPRLVGKEGVLDTFLPTLDAREREGLLGSARTVRAAIDALPG